MSAVSDGGPSVLSLLRIPVIPPRDREFVERFVALDIFRRASEDNGMQSARLLSSQADAGDFIVVAEWPSSDSYGAWLANPARERVNAELAPFLNGEMVGGVFVVVHEL
jgi:hypothetical protein